MSNGGMQFGLSPTPPDVSSQEVPDHAVARALQCQFWAPNHKLKGSWRLVQLGPTSRLAAAKLCSSAWL